MLLSDITEIALALKTEKREKIKLFHKLLFNEEGDRLNRSRIRNFHGFDFGKDDINFKTKLADITTTFSLIELISIANILKIDINGTLPDLAERILTFLTDLESLQENVKNCEISDDETEEIPNSTQSKVQSDNVSLNNNADKVLDSHISYADSLPLHTRLPFNFNDIDYLVPKYTGEKHENVKLWFQKFEAFATSFNLSDIHKFIFAQRALTGIALLFVKSECTIHSYSQLKSALLSEFGEQINSAEIHDILNRRRIQDKESIFEYFLIMREIASRAQLDDMALIHYVIQGINDSPQNKTILYGATNLAEFKTKLKIYEEIQTNGQKVKIKIPEQTTKNPAHTKTNSIPIRCFNCGKNGHKSVNCRDKNKGLKCFRCNSFGHKASDNKCSIPVNTHNSPVRALNNHISSRQDMHKIVKISGILIDALIDTGSHATLLREDLYRQSELPDMTDAQSTLNGFGSSKVQPLGSFQADIEIDHDIFSTTIYVISQHQMSFPLIIGTDIITQGTLTVNEDGISLRKTDTNNFFVQLANVVDNTSDIDLSHILDKKHKQEVRNLVNSYKPNKTRTTDMKMSIVLKDDMPVSQHARRMSIPEKEFVSKHTQQLQQKFDVSKMDLKAALELQNPLVVQYNVLEELQQELHNSEEKCKKLEEEVKIIPVITSEKNKLQSQVDKYDKVNKERSKMITTMEEKCLILDEQLKNTKNLVLQKEEELFSLKEQLHRLTSDKNTSHSISSSLKSLEEENLVLKSKITLLELQKVEKKPDTSAQVATKELSPDESEESDYLLSRTDFLNSILVDNEANEIERKDGKINVLKNVVKETDYQFGELCKMLKASQGQLSLLTERNETNVSLLQSKESLINDFKSVQEKQLRDIAKTNILKYQEQSKRSYDKRRKPPKKYQVGDLVAIQRTQFGPGLKLKIKYFGPYKVQAVKGHDRYDVVKVGNHEGPNTTSSSADLMKPWPTI